MRRDKFPVGADPSFSVIKTYDVAFSIPGVEPAFAHRVSYVIPPEAKILSASADSGGEKGFLQLIALDTLESTVKGDSGSIMQFPSCW